MAYETYRYIFMAAAVLGTVMFFVTLILFVTLKIPKVIGDLTGIAAKKAIQTIREQNDSASAKGYKKNPVNLQSGRSADKISTQKLSGNVEKSTEEETVMIKTYADETTLLPVNPEMERTFEIEQDITFIHTDEFIIV